MRVPHVGPGGLPHVGSQAHLEALHDAFVGSHVVYDPRTMDWPALSDEEVQRLQALPVWQEAIRSEHFAAARVRAMVDAEPDPLLREGIAMQAEEEARHARLVESLLRAYAIPLPPRPVMRPVPPEWGFVRLGWEETFDAFFAFGLFRVAGDSGLFPAPLVAIFDTVMQEEARHILFFANWSAARAAQLAPLRRARFVSRSGAALVLQVLSRIGTAITASRDAGRADGFVQVPESVATLSVRELAAICLAEHARRLAPYDAALLRPTIVPALVRRALRLPASAAEPLRTTAPAWGLHAATGGSGGAAKTP